MIIQGLRIRQWFAIAFVAGMMLLISAFFSIATFREGLKCETSSQLCYYQNHYLWMSHNVAAFRFSDVKAAHTVFLYQGKDGKHYGIQFDLGQLPGIVVSRPSSYIANKEIPRLKAYLANPKTNGFELPPIPFGAEIFLMLMPLCAAIASCHAIYKAALKANQEQAHKGNPGP